MQVSRFTIIGFGLGMATLIIVVAVRSKLAIYIFGNGHFNWLSRCSDCLDCVMEENEQKSSNTGIASWSYCRDLFLDNYYMAAVRPAVYITTGEMTPLLIGNVVSISVGAAVVIIGTYSNHKTSTLN